MTTATVNPTLDIAPAHWSLGADHAIRSRRHDVAAVRAATRSEWIKLRTLRSNAAILGFTGLIGVVMSLVLAVIVKTDPYDHEPFTVADTFIVSTWLTTVLAVVMGSLLFTSEVQHGTYANAVAARPARWVTLAAKTTVAAGFGLAMGAVGMAAGLGGALVGGIESGDTSMMPATAGWGLLLTTLAAPFGLGVGLIIRHSAAAVSTALVWTLVIENLIRSVAPATVSRFLPFSAANGLLGTTPGADDSEIFAVALSRVQDALLFGGYTVAALTMGTALLYRRDTP
jgi:ABC-2 type transport system permease protein